jgi:hypothetical protein
MTEEDLSFELIREDSSADKKVYNVRYSGQRGAGRHFLEETWEYNQDHRKCWKS